MNSINQSFTIDSNIGIPDSPRQTLKKARARQLDLYSAKASRIGSSIFMLLVAVAITIGWLQRGEELITAKEGVGYIIGIVGGVGLLMQFLYPLRKHAPFMQRWGAVKHWFRIHKALGLLAPTLILFHANFRLHAVNSNVALFSMLIVVASGLVGRFIYMKIHSSHYGEVASLKELQDTFGVSRDEMDHDKFITRRVKTRLHEFEDKALRPSRTVIHGIWRLVSMGHQIRKTRALAYKDLAHGLELMARRKNWDDSLLQTRLKHDRDLVKTYLMSVGRIAEFSAYRRMFSLWHTLHMPLFFMLIVTGVVHVVAVHLY
jgi:hypothetical protein